jgi:hypothetical protein
VHTLFLITQQRKTDTEIHPNFLTHPTQVLALSKSKLPVPHDYLLTNMSNNYRFLRTNMNNNNHYLLTKMNIDEIKNTFKRIIKAIDDGMKSLKQVLTKRSGTNIDTGVPRIENKVDQVLPKEQVAAERAKL